MSEREDKKYEARTKLLPEESGEGFVKEMTKHAIKLAESADKRDKPKPHKKEKYYARTNSR